MIELLKFVISAKFIIGFLLGGMGAFIYLKTAKK
jgi:hypothetical protein